MERGALASAALGVAVKKSRKQLAIEAAEAAAYRGPPVEAAYVFTAIAGALLLLYIVQSRNLASTPRCVCAKKPLRRARMALLRPNATLPYTQVAASPRFGEARVRGLGPEVLCRLDGSICHDHCHGTLRTIRRDCLLCRVRRAGPTAAGAAGVFSGEAWQGGAEYWRTARCESSVMDIHLWIYWQLLVRERE